MDIGMQTRQEVVLITGASGFIGSTLVQRLAERYQLVGLDRQGMASAMIDTMSVDLSRGEQVRGALREVRARHGTRLAAVIHLAAYYDLSGEPNPRYQEITLRGTQHLLGALDGFTVEQFIFSSTMLVHAPVKPGEYLTEDAPLAPTWAYPRSKMLAEDLIKGWRSDMPVVLLRLAGVYDDNCHSAFLAQQIARIYERQWASHVYPGDLHSGQAALHVEDLASAVEQLIERRHQLPRELTLLLGEPETMSYGEIQAELGDLIHTEHWETRTVPKSLAKLGLGLQAWLGPLVPGTLDQGEAPFLRPWMVTQADAHYALDIRRAQTLLGWTPQHRLRETLPRMVAALKADPAACYASNGLTPPHWLRHRPAWPSADTTQGSDFRPPV